MGLDDQAALANAARLAAPAHEVRNHCALTHCEISAGSSITVTAEATANGAVGDLCSLHWTADADI